ncbi:amino acid adenylation domain-containing protein [Nocardia sp. NPDC052566]|uniref:amino acid adenylation domain-containing protein n=1 Tax=Nocardia sp. NPDC052566 TaxID=3364330 RepID=UPI0037CAD8BD
MVSGFEGDGAYAPEPIAVVSMSCRFGGGVASVEDMWQTMVTGRDTVTAMPTDRGWDVSRLGGTDHARATSSTRRGNFLTDAGGFDAGFFGISPREAIAMEPQQRVLLEASWEAIERAGIDPRILQGSRTGVYFGVMQAEYGPRMADMERTKGYQDTGVAASVASGRVAYVLGLRGPALSIDTACSSSLVAIHTAMRALRSGECSLALAGGATIHSSASLFVGFSLMRVLSEDGATRPFADTASGFGLGEGGGVLLLERLSDAVRLGHPVLAVLRGSAVVSDGASTGLTAPDQHAQQQVIEYALRDAGIGAADIDVVEAHGTGTRIGDPIEVAALTNTYGAVRGPGNPVWIGSAKSNFGHTQAGSGVAGMIKMIESIRRGIVPATAHFQTPSPHIDWSSGKVRVAGELMAWPAVAGAPRRGGVSANGISGVNCHIIVEQAPDLPRRNPDQRGEPSMLPLVLSARTDSALAAQAEALSTHLRQRVDLAPLDIGYSLAAGRASFDKRAVVLGADRDELITALDRLATPDTSRSAHLDTGGDVVFVFPGQGPQWHGMAVELLDTAPVFAEHVAQCESALAEFVEWSVTDVLRGAHDAPPMERVDVVQPVLFTVMVALARLWESLGVRPAAVIGHSQGEITAAHIAGALSLRDAAMIVARRATIMATATGNGAMAAVALPADQASELVDDDLAIACVNSPRSCVLSGPTIAVENLLARCAADGIDARRLPALVASHSPLMQPLRHSIESALASVEPNRTHIPFLSTVTGEPIDTAQLDAEYWYRNTRETVRFEHAVRTAYLGGAKAFLEVSAHPVLTASVGETLNALTHQTGDAVPITVAKTLRRNDGGLRRFLSSAAGLYSAGIDVDWARYYRGHDARTVDLPTYPFERQRYWMAHDEGLATAVRGAGSTRPVDTCVPTAPETPRQTAPAGAVAIVDAAAIVRSALTSVLGGYSGVLPESTSTFTQLGLDSLASLTLRQQIEEASGVRLQVTDLVEHPTPAALTAYVRSELDSPTTISAVHQPTGPIVDRAPLTPYQADLVVLAARYPHLPVVQAAHYFRITGATDIDRLRSAILRLHQRHDALRLRMDVTTTPPSQYLGDPPGDIVFVDLLDLPDPVAALDLWTRDRATTVLPVHGPQSEFTILREDTESLIVFTRFHHALADGWSLIIMARELSATYFGAGPTGPAPSCLTMHTRYRDYRESGQWAHDRDALVGRFRTLTPALFERQIQTPTQNLRYTHHFERAAVTALRRRGSTVAQILAALGISLHNLHQRGDIVVGVALLNRETTAELDTIGDFTNVLPIHIPATGTSTLTELASTVETQVRDLQARQRFPYGELLRALREHTGTMSALFDVRLTYNKVPDHEHAARLRRDVTTLAVGNMLGAITIAVYEFEHEATIDLEIFYAPDLFTEATISSAVDEVIDILSGRTVSTVPTSSAHHPDTVDTADNSSATVTTRLVATSETAPTRRALVWTGPDRQTHALTYAEFSDKVHTLAACLRETGLRTNEFVAVLLPRSPALVIAIHAIMAAGGTYVPLAMDYPPHRIQTLLDDSGACLLITDLTDATSYPVEVISPTATPTHHREPGTTPTAELAYMIYTSGSTGTPKGVLAEHRSLNNLLDWMQQRYLLTDTDVVLFKAPHTFDASVPELMWPIHAGAQIAILDEGAHIDPRRIIDAIETHRVTVIQFVPSMLGPFLDELHTSPTALDRIRTLRHILCGGEALHPSLVRRFGDLFAAAGLDDVVLTNLWGPTEATYCASFFDITVDQARKIATVPIGTPIANVGLTVVDPNGQVVPDGEIGEILVSGIAVARGYHHREHLTANAFTIDPHHLDGRTYRTGDLGRYDNDGNLEYLGRTDDQVKVRGNRISLGEVASHLSDCPGIDAAVVLDEPNPDGTNTLVAFHTGDTPTSEIVAFVRKRLPQYAIPSAFVAVDSIPVTANGKADRAALQNLRRGHTRPSPTITRSHTEIETTLLAAWTEVLGTPPTNRDDDFFTTGGDSIAALQFRTAVEKQGIDLELNELFTNPSITALTRQLASRT